MPDVRQKTGGCMTEELFRKGTGAGRGAVHEPGGCTVEELNRLGPEGIWPITLPERRASVSSGPGLRCRVRLC